MAFCLLYKFNKLPQLEILIFHKINEQHSYWYVTSRLWFSGSPCVPEVKWHIPSTKILNRGLQRQGAKDSPGKFPRVSTQSINDVISLYVLIIILRMHWSSLKARRCSFPKNKTLFAFLTLMSFQTCLTFLCESQKKNCKECCCSFFHTMRVNSDWGCQSVTSCCPWMKENIQVWNNMRVNDDRIF